VLRLRSDLFKSTIGRGVFKGPHSPATDIRLKWLSSVDFGGRL
jgi:hypothetical protein